MRGFGWPVDSAFGGIVQFWLFFLLSVLMHAGLFSAVGTGRTGDGPSTPDGGGLPGILQVNVIRHHVPDPPSTLSNDTANVVNGANAANTASVRLPDSIGSEAVSFVNAASSDGSAAMPVHLVAEPYYHSPGELTERPNVLHDFFPDLMIFLPDLEPRPTILRLFINEKGHVDKVSLDEASMLSEQAQNFIIKAFMKVRFRPGHIDNMPVKSQMKMEVVLESAAGHKQDPNAPRP